jgi:enoyl-[acyl-carrier protein] reductase II
MDPETFVQHIRKAHNLTQAPVGVNIPLIYQHTDVLVEIAIQERVPVVFTSAGTPKRYTEGLKKAGIKVFHVCSSPELAVKCQQAGVDGVVAEGFEAGGHVGREELTTLVLVEQVRKAVTCPVIAAGGIATGRQMAAVMLLGADGVQVGTRFALTQESSGHAEFKKACLRGGSDATLVVLKKGVPVRLLKNPFRDRLVEAESRGADLAELLSLLGQGRTKRGMFEGDVVEGELEIGQVAGTIQDLPPAGEVLRRIVEEYQRVRAGLPSLDA